MHSAGMRRRGIIGCDAARHLPGRWLALSAFLLAACESGPPVPANTVTDSAGIRLVESQAPVWRDEDAWRVVADSFVEPLLTGSIADAVGLADGRTVVLTADGTLRFFDAAGQPGFVVSRSNVPAPGSAATRLARRGAELLVTQRGAEPTLVFDTAGRFLRAVSYPRPGGAQFISQFHVLADSNVIAIRPPAGLIPQNGTWTERVRFIFFTATGDSTSFALPGIRFTNVDGRAEPLGLAPTLGFVIGDSLLYAGFPDAYDIGVYGSDGRLRARIRRAWRPEPVATMHVSAFRAELIAWLEQRNPAARPNVREMQRRIVNEHPVADTLPAFGRLLLDATGHLWVERVPPVPPLPTMLRPTRREPTPWDVFAPDGTWLGSVETPADLYITDITHDRVIGLDRTVGGERVRIYPLTRRDTTNGRAAPGS